MADTPPPCDPDIYANGKCVAIWHDHPGSEKIEAWVKGVASASAQPVDWHFFGGRALILTTGDAALVRNAIEAAIPYGLEVRGEHNG